MSEPAIIAKLRKLLALANDGDTPECATARKLYRRLLAKHGLAAAEIEERREHRFKFVRGTRDIVGRVAGYLGLEIYVRKRGRRDVWYIEATATEFHVWSALYAYSCGIYAAKRRELQRQMRRELRSFALGHVIAAYPIVDTAVVCPECGATAPDYGVDLAREEWRCLACGFTKQSKPLDLDGLAFMDGYELSRKPLPQP